MKIRIAVLALCALLQLLFVTTVYGQQMLIQPPSAEANGRGGLYSSTHTDDPLAPLTNPGLLGFLAERNGGVFGFYPNRTVWGVQNYWYEPDEYVPQYRYTAHAVMIGLNRNVLQKIFHRDLPLSIGLGYQETEFSAPVTAYWHYSHIYQVVKPREKVKSVGVGVGWQGKILQCGLGANYKFIHLDNGLGIARPNAYDFGLVLQSSLEKIFWPTNENRDWQPFITPMIGYSLLNAGERIRHSDTDWGEPLPRSAAINLGLSVGLNSNQLGGRDLQLISVEVGEQISDLLVGYYLGRTYMYPGYFGEYPYAYEDKYQYYFKNLLGDIQPFNDLVLGKPHPWVSRQQGIELSLLEAGSVRWGHLKTSRDYNYITQYTTNGFSIKAAGLLKLATGNREQSSTSLIGTLARQFDLQYHYSAQRIDGGYTSLQEKVAYHQLLVLWRH